MWEEPEADWEVAVDKKKINRQVRRVLRVADDRTGRGRAADVRRAGRGRGEVERKRTLGADGRGDEFGRDKERGIVGRHI